MFRSGVTKFRAFVVSAAVMTASALGAATPASAQVIDSYLLIQPIVVCDDAGNNCAQLVMFPEEMKKIYAQAGVFPVLLPFNQLNDTDLQSVSGIADIDGSGGMSADPLTLNAWFVLDLPTGDPNSVLYGEAWVDANGLVINSTAVANFNGGIGRLDTFAHEVGHNLGLGHDDFGAGGANNLMTAGSSRTVPSTINDITPDGLMLSVLTQDQIDEIRDSAFVQLAMDCLGDGNNNVITKTFAEVCLNLRGLDGDDILSLTGGVVLGDMTGDAGNDILLVGDGSTVLGNVDGGSGNDLIGIGADGDPTDVLGGTGNDLITLAVGSLVTGSVYGDDNDGDESDDGDDLIVMNGGTVNGNVDGEGADDGIFILGGSVGGHVLGGGGDDVIETAEPATITGNVDGEAGNDTITIASDPADVLGGTGSDVITLNTGAVVVNVFGDDNDGDEGDDGADVIVMNGGTVSGAVDGEGGDDVISIQGGSAGSMLGGGGADVFNLSGGSVTGSVNGEGGDDLFNLTAGSFGSLLGGSGADGFLLSGGTVSGNVEAGTGNDEILLTGSGISGDILSSDGADLIVMTAGFVDDIRGGLDNDLIQVLGGNVFGSVFGEGGDDVILTAEPGTVDGDVDGGSGNDIITIASDPADVLGGAGDDVINIVGAAFVTGSVYGDDNDGFEGDDGHDTINLAGGIIFDSVFGEGGNDFINLSGTVVIGGIFGDGGDDGFLISGGFTTGVVGGDGEDAAVWTGGTIVLLVDMGTGSDSLDIYGANAGGSAFQAGLLELDGGDDASGADGQLDVLNLRGVVEVLTDLQNWEFINLVDTSRGDMGTASRVIDTEEFFIEAGSILFASSAAGGASYVIDGLLLNAGVLDMRDGIPSYDTFTVTDLYTGGAGSQFHTDTFLGGVGSPSDLLVVGDETEGQTALHVFDTNPGPGAYNPAGIPIVDVSTGITAADHFVLVNGFTGFAGPIDKGLFFYDLALRPDNVHVLIGVPDLEAFQLGRIPSQAQSAWHSTTGVWLDRTADLRAYLDGSAAPGSRGPVSPGLWLRGVGSVLDREDSLTFTLFNKSYDFNTSYGQNSYGVFAGGDWAWSDAFGPGDSTVLGVFVGYTGWDSRFDQQSANGGFSTTEAGGVSFGLYTTYVNRGFFLDGVFKADLPTLDMSFPGLEPVGPTEAGTDVRSLGGVLDAGYRHKLGFNWYVEGLGTLAYVDTKIDPVDLAGSVIDFGADQSLRGRLGLGFGGTFQAGEVATLVSRLSLSVWQEFDGRNGTEIFSPMGAPLDIRDDLSGTYGEVSTLVDIYGNQNGLSFFVKSDYRFGEDTSEFAGSLGLRYQQ